jgi:chromosome segregation ATPase
MKYQSAYKSPSVIREWMGPATLGLVLAVGALSGTLYYRQDAFRQTLAGHENKLSNLDDREEELLQRLKAAEEQNQSLRAQLEITGQKLGMTQLDLDQTRQAAEALRRNQQKAAAQIGTVNKQVKTLSVQSGQRFAQLSGAVKTASTDIAATRKSLEETRGQLVSAIGDITNAKTLIARNSNELAELRRRGEKNYIEFDLPKQKEPVRVGDVALLLKKADEKHQRYNLEVITDDVKTEKKDRDVNEPVQFYRGRNRALYEIVVNQVSKNRIAGYLATPK